MCVIRVMSECARSCHINVALRGALYCKEESDSRQGGLLEKLVRSSGNSDEKTSKNALAVQCVATGDST